MEPPPSHGRIRKPLGSISALTKLGDGVPVGPPVEEVNDLSQTCKWNIEMVRCNIVPFNSIDFKSR